MISCINDFYINAINYHNFSNEIDKARMDFELRVTYTNLNSQEEYFHHQAKLNYLIFYYIVIQYTLI